MSTLEICWNFRKPENLAITLKFDKTHKVSGIYFFQVLNLIWKYFFENFVKFLQVQKKTVTIQKYVQELQNSTKLTKISLSVTV